MASCCVQCAGVLLRNNLRLHQTILHFNTRFIRQYYPSRKIRPYNYSKYAKYEISFKNIHVKLKYFIYRYRYEQYLVFRMYQV